MSEPPHDAVAAPEASGLHPELEELAALADGTLAGAEAERVRAHVDSCERCHEIFAETLHLTEDLLEETGDGENVVPFPFEGRRRSPWTGWAVAALLVLGVGIGLWRNLASPPSLEISDLAAPLAGHVQQVPAWREITRGIEKEEIPSIDQAFQAGVAVLNLQVALESNAGQEADAAAAQVCMVLGIERSAEGLTSNTLLDPSLRNFYGGLRPKLPTATPRTFARDAAKNAAALRTALAEEAYFDLGEWTAAGRFAAAAGLPFPQQKEASALLRRLRKDDPDLASEVQATLQTIAGLSANQSGELRAACEEILAHYYRKGRPFDSPE
jgi:Putative zinc-finger